MKCSYKLKSIYSRKGIKQIDVAKEFDMSNSSFNNKMRDCNTRFNFSDLIRLADICDVKLAFIDDENNIIETFTSDDLKD